MGRLKRVEKLSLSIMATALIVVVLVLSGLLWDLPDSVSFFSQAFGYDYGYSTPTPTPTQVYVPPGGGSVPSSGTVTQPVDDDADADQDTDTGEDEVTVDDIDDLQPDEAADQLEEASDENAADVLEQIETGSAAAIVEAMETERAADIIEAMEDESAADIVEAVETEKATSIVEVMETARAAKIVEKVTPEKSATILQNTTVQKCARVMESMETDNLVLVLEKMVKTAVTERLPEAKPATVHAIDDEVVLNLLPDVPAEHLIEFVFPPSQPDNSLPTVELETETTIQYLVNRVVKGWADVSTTPLPLTKVKVEFTSAASDVISNIGILADKPGAISQDLPAGQNAHTYMDISIENIDQSNIEQGIIAFQVDNDWITENGIHKWAISLYRYEGDTGSWVPLPTSRIDADDDYQYYSAVTPGFSTFAIAGSQQITSQLIQVTGLTISPIKADPGDTVNISATVADQSGTGGSYIASLWLNNIVESSKKILLSGGGSAEALFTVSDAEEGIYSVRVGRMMGSFTVGEPEPTATPSVSPTPTITPSDGTPTPTATPDEDEGGAFSMWFIIGPLLGLVIIGAAVAVYFLNKKGYIRI